MSALECGSVDMEAREVFLVADVPLQRAAIPAGGVRSRRGKVRSVSRWGWWTTPKLPSPPRHWPLERRISCRFAATKKVLLAVMRVIHWWADVAQRK
ncbi:MAG: hypothetical protein H7210_14710 [Pyrinomonadaceae bacterium]|nr:hypothetical protein [Phycisphaerales bacterium]